MPNCLMPFMIWVSISHFVLNTIFFVITIIVFSSPSSCVHEREKPLHYIYMSTCKYLKKTNHGPRIDSFTKFYFDLFIGIIYYILGVISFIVVFLLYRSLKDEQKNEFSKCSYNWVWHYKATLLLDIITSGKKMNNMPYVEILCELSVYYRNRCVTLFCCKWAFFTWNKIYKFKDCIPQTYCTL